MTTLAWHFTGQTLRDGRPLPPVGEWLEHNGRVVMCNSGLHFSRRLIDALRYAPGNLIHRVRVDAIVVEDADKGVCRRRKISWTVDGEALLRQFARDCALDVIDLWQPSEDVVAWLVTGDKAFLAAPGPAGWDAASARAASEDAARDASEDAAWAASAWAAARAASEDAAWDASEDAAWDASAWDAAWDATRAFQNRRLTRAVLAARRQGVVR